MPAEYPTLNLKASCLHIRHKLMYVDERQAQRGLIDDQSDTRVFWCARTQDHLGPDGQAVDPECCRAGRTCYSVGAAVQ